ncbi:hypothetical protein [Bradyrhizobium sp. AZCC 2289]|uniref:hypothetical protein n=1 Tax=Bradyrhizobium sp. AZCC 2289 TaxID=3117026 RepID=UPI002FEFD9C3
MHFTYSQLLGFFAGVQTLRRNSLSAPVAQLFKVTDQIGIIDRKWMWGRSFLILLDNEFAVTARL